MSDEGVAGVGLVEGADARSSGKLYVGRAWFRMERPPADGGAPVPPGPSPVITAPLGVPVAIREQPEPTGERTVVVTRPRIAVPGRPSQLALPRWTVAVLGALAFAGGIVVGAVTRPGQPAPRPSAPLAKHAPIIAPLAPRTETPPAPAAPSPPRAPAAPSPPRPPAIPTRRPPAAVRRAAAARAPAPKAAPAPWVDPFAE
jgi:hypothetical protein